MAEGLRLVAGIDIDPDPSTSRTLPGWAYTDPALCEREREAIFFKSWLYAGAIDELPRPGDYLTAGVFDQSVVVIRGKDGALRGFYNVCQHRAHELLRGRGNARVITCPYHAWSYHADGALRTARGLEKQPGFAAEEFSLTPVRVEVFAGKFVFFNLDLEATPLSQLAAGLADELARRIPAFDTLVPADGTTSSDYDVNWKVALDNYLECYHCGNAHPSFGDILDYSSWRTTTHDIWTTQSADLAPPQGKPYPYPVADDAPNRRGQFWWLWPSTAWNMMPGGAGYRISSFVPSRVDRSRRWGQSFRLPGAAVDAGRAAYAQSVVGPEDTELLNAVQRGLRSRGYAAGRFVIDPEGGVTTEAALHHFHRLVAAALALD